MKEPTPPRNLLDLEVQRCLHETPDEPYVLGEEAAARAQKMGIPLSRVRLAIRQIVFKRLIADRL
ncbi:hypothetical protein [Streptosporangium sp. KLBMP 9127]|nr:hypothetical protein [Streptosporangium sp. KLBMP 9127]